jgi:hypothetical protein
MNCVSVLEVVYRRSNGTAFQAGRRRDPRPRSIVKAWAKAEWPVVWQDMGTREPPAVAKDRGQELIEATAQ